LKKVWLSVIGYQEPGVCGGAVAKRALVEILRRGKAAPHDDIVSGGEVHTTGVMATPRKTQRKAPASEIGRYNCGTQPEACVTSRGRRDTRRFSDGYGKCAAGFAVSLELKADYWELGLAVAEIFGVFVRVA
jgi:hypothetical protein